MIALLVGVTVLSKVDGRRNLLEDWEDEYRREMSLRRNDWEDEYPREMSLRRNDWKDEYPREMSLRRNDQKEVAKRGDADDCKARCQKIDDENNCTCQVALHKRQPLLISCWSQCLVGRKDDVLLNNLCKESGGAKRACPTKKDAVSADAFKRFLRRRDYYYDME